MNELRKLLEKKDKLTVNEAAMYAGKHPNTIRFWIVKEVIKATRNELGMWLIDTKSLKEHVEL